MLLNVRKFQDMVREIHALRSLKSSKESHMDGLQNIVELIECMSTTNSFYLVMSLCNGGDLREYINFKRAIPIDVT